MKLLPLSRRHWRLAALLVVPLPARADELHWIWHDNQGDAIKPDEVSFFRKTFHVDTLPTKALLSVAADDEAMVYLNGKQVAHPKDYQKPAFEDVTAEIRKGENVFAIRGVKLESDQAGVVAVLQLKLSKQHSDFVITDRTWLSSDKDEHGWRDLDFSNYALSSSRSLRWACL